MTNLSAGWRRLATSRLKGAIARVLRGRWTPTLHLRGLTRRGRFTSLEAGLVVILVTEIFGGRRPKDTRPARHNAAPDPPDAFAAITAITKPTGVCEARYLSRVS